MSDSLLFWLIAAAMAALALAFALPGLLVRRTSIPRPSAGALNAAICRRELALLARARAEHTLTEAEYVRARDDAERRLLAEASDAPAPVTVAPPRSMAIATAIALPVLAFGLYALSGDPAALRKAATQAPPGADGPRVSVADRDELLRRLGRNPGDGRGWVLLARADFEADRYADAAQAYAKALEASPKVAADASVWCEYADALGMAQGGTLAGRPQELVLRALALDPSHPKALEMAGSAAFEQRDYAAAARHWRRLLTRLAEGSREQRELAAAVARVEHLASGARGSAEAPR